MTENQFQAARKVMQSANHVRGLITTAKGEVARWGNIESSYRESLQPEKAEGARKCLDRAMEKLDKVRLKFAAMTFPAEDAKPATRWISAVDNDSFNYLPKEIKESRFDEAAAEGFQLHLTKSACQNECDLLNAQ